MASYACVIEGCDKPSSSRGWCVMHYTRWLRHGDPLVVLHAEKGQGRWLTSSGYWATNRPDHPLASGGPQVYVHRVVLYDSIGPGGHSCHWCSRPIDWSAHKSHPKWLVVDHVDFDKLNNDPSNLVASCQPCNVGRSNTRRKAA